MPTYQSTSEAHTERIAAAFARTLHGGEALLLEGDLGAGKTAFVRGLARGLGVRDRITSPTFVLMRVHGAGTRTSGHEERKSAALTPVRRLVHVDAYRVHGPRDLEAIGLLEYVGRPDTVVAIEWGTRVQSLLAHARVTTITLVQKSRGASRTIHIARARASSKKTVHVMTRHH